MRDNFLPGAFLGLTFGTALCLVVLFAGCDGDDSDLDLIPGEVSQVLIIVEGADDPARTFQLTLEADSIPDGLFFVEADTPWEGRTFGELNDTTRLDVTFLDGLDTTCVWVLWGSTLWTGDRFCPTDGTIEAVFFLGGAVQP